jgi:chitodextrinase
MQNAPATEGVPNFDHIVLILLENSSYTSVIGNPQMTHLNALAQQNTLLSNYFAVRHPSLPNYIALMSGSTQNITKDCKDCFINQPNLADRIEASGRTWKSYLESMPSPCFIGDSNPYAQKHNPLLYFDSIRLDAARCNRSIVPLTALDADLAANQLPNFSFIMPNMCNSGHNCDAATADTWVGNMVTKLQSSPAFGKNSLIIVTFDEGAEKSNESCCGLGKKAGGQIAAILISPKARQGFNDTTDYSHYSLLKMILSAWNLPDLGQSASAPQILAPWNPALGSTSSNSSATPTTAPPLTNQNTGAQPGCAISSSGSATITVCFSSPASDSTLKGDTAITATANVTGTSTSVQRMTFYLDGAYLLSDYQSPYTFTLPTTKWADGSHTLSAAIQMRDKSASQQASLSVNFANGISTPPANTDQFKPSIGSFPTNGAPFTVAAGGDGASGEINAGKVSDMLTSLNPNLFLYLGDVYEQGSKAEFLNWYGNTTFFGRLRPITNPTVGNHEYLTKGAAGYFDYWNNIPSYYSYSAGGWHFISLNSNSQYEPTDPQSAQYLWLQQDLAANSGACTIVYYHHPLFNIGPEGSTAQMTDIWKLMAQNKVTIVLNGHDHDYQRWVPLDGDGQPNSNGITEFVVGSTGHGLQHFKTTDSRVAYSNDTNPTGFGVLLLQLNASGANFSYRNINGSVLDSGVIPCGSATQSDTQPPTIPVALKANVGNGKVDLTWSSSSDNVGVTGYTIYRNGISLATVSGTSLAYSDTTAAPTTTYDYTVDALDQAGNHSPASPAASVTTGNMPSSLAFSPVADTYVDTSKSSTNYGGLTSLRADASPDVHSYLRFNVTGLGGRAISRARLRIFANSSLKQGSNALAVADNSWDEMGMNGSNAPALGNTIAQSSAITAGSWISFDVTSYVTGEGTFSFGITNSNSTAVDLASRESGANAPQLVIDLR